MTFNATHGDKIHFTLMMMIPTFAMSTIRNIGGKTRKLLMISINKFAIGPVVQGIVIIILIIGTMKKLIKFYERVGLKRFYYNN